MKQINLTQGSYAIVDDKDFERVNQYKWCYDGGYAHRKIKKNGKDIKIYMHRFIMGVEKQEVDHINGVGLDNRNQNLRIATHRQNLINTKKRIDNTSGFKGVSYSKYHKKYRAYIRPYGKQIFLGYFNNPQDAHLAYGKKAKEIFGEFARIC